jgi:glutamate dehydrogenase (NAD(P)+)
LADWSNTAVVTPEKLLTQSCDILVPAAVERVITEHNAGPLKCRILAEGANGPTTPEADRILDRRRDEIFVIPDILRNSGGVILSQFRVGSGLAAALLDRGRGQRPAGTVARTVIPASDEASSNGGHIP